jgi:Fe-S cluster assembly protein SufD
VIVRPGAQKTNAEQFNPNLLLTQGADVNTKPQLEIYADDVKCSHGSTVGCMDPEALFYLRSRGIAETRAREILTRGFADEIAAALPTAELAVAVGKLIAERIRDGAEERVVT